MFFKNNTYKKITNCYYKINNQWKQIITGFYKKDGKWKQLYNFDKKQAVIVINNRQIIIPDNVYEIEIHACAGGGGGFHATPYSIDEQGYSGTGGKAGEFIITTINVNPNDILDISVGDGGLSDTNGQNTIIKLNNTILFNLKGGLSGIPSNKLGEGNRGLSITTLGGIGGKINPNQLCGMKGTGGKGWGSGGGGSGTGTKTKVAFCSGGGGGDEGLIIEGIPYPAAEDGNSNGGKGGKGAKGIAVILW